MGRQIFARGLLALAVAGLSAGGFSAAAYGDVPAGSPPPPVWVSPWQPEPTSPDMPDAAPTVAPPEIRVPAPSTLVDAATVATPGRSTQPDWYRPWDMPTLVRDNFAVQVLPPQSPDNPQTPPVAVRTAEPASKTAPSMRFVVPTVLRSMGALVPDMIEQTSIPASAMTLDELLGVIRSRHPEAEVVAGFYDWRTVSQYRRVAGLHLGYDIAMPAGTVVPSGWAGKVVAVANWVGPEYGITVDTNGFRTTYGHLSPLVKEGDVVMAGQPVGSIVRDHVDVKMRNANGDYVDFGAHQMTSEPVALAPAPFSSDPREMGVLRFLVAQETVYQAEDRLKQDRASAAHLRESLRDSLGTVKELGTQLPKMKGYYEQGLIARVDVENAQRKWQTVQSSLKSTKELASQAEDRLTRSENELIVARQQLAQSQADNKKLGIQAAEITGFVNKYVEKHPSVLKEARTEERTAAAGADTTPATPELAKEKQRLEVLERLYQDGAVALREVEDARARYAALEAAQHK